MVHKDTDRFASGWVLRPSVAVTLLHGGAISCWFLYLSLTLRYPSVWREEVFRMIPTSHYLACTATNLALGLWLLLGLRWALRVHPGLRRGQLAGVGLALAYLVVVQVGVQALHRPWSGPVIDEVRLDQEVELLEPGAREIVETVREALAEAHPDLRTAFTMETWFFRNPERMLGQVTAEGGEVRLSLYDVLSGDETAPSNWVIEQALGPGARTPHASLRIPFGKSAEELRQLHEQLVVWGRAVRRRP